MLDGSLSWADLPAGSREALVDTSPWERIPSGTTVVGTWYTSYLTGPVAGGHVQSFQLPALPSAPLVGNDAVNMQNVMPVDADPACSGSFAGPTAPAGKVCLYVYGTSNVAGFNGKAFEADVTFNNAGTFVLGWTDLAASTQSLFALAWAYTAP